MSETTSLFLVERDAEGRITSGVTERPLSDLPAGDVVVEVEYSSLNYKDALAATGHRGVVSKFPHVPGIDLAGRVHTSDSPLFRPGDAVICTGYELGQGHWGGWSKFVRLPAKWLLPRPAGLTAREAMLYGTAGITAAESVAVIQQHGVRPEAGEVLVTGATGGVGSLGVAMLAKAGYKVVASTGKKSAHEWLTRLGASRIITREDVLEGGDRPLLKTRWAAALDTVGGATLSAVLRAQNYAGCVTACGLVAGAELPTNVYPFLLRGVTLAGIESSQLSVERRRFLWARMAGSWRVPDLASIENARVPLAGVAEYVARILAGGVQGRVLVTP